MADLDGYGLHELTWEACDDVLTGPLAASPADARGRGIAHLRYGAKARRLISRVRACTCYSGIASRGRAGASRSKP